MPTSWKGALTTLIPKKVGEVKILDSIRPICLVEHGCQNSDECLGQTTLQTARKKVG